MRRRSILRLTGAALATAVGTGYAVTEDEFGSIQEVGDPITFEDSAELLLEPASLPGGGWERVEMDDGDVLDVRATFEREFEEGEEVEGVPGVRWIVTSAAAGRDTEAEASDLYEELFADFRARVGRARLMDLELASEAAIAGYDGLTGVIFRDTNCVGSVGFADCSDLTGCFSHVELGEQLARRKQESWRAEPDDSDEDVQPEADDEQPDDDDDGGDGNDDDDGGDGNDDDDDDDGGDGNDDDDDDDDPGPNGDPDSLELVDSYILGGDPDEEYITLGYAGEGTLDMGNWTIEDDGLVPASTLSPFEFPSEFALESGTDVTVVTGEGAATDDTLYWGVGRQVWSEDGDVVYVLDHNGEIVLQEPIGANSPNDDPPDGPSDDDDPPEDPPEDDQPDNGNDDPPDGPSDDDDPPEDPPEDDQPDNGNDDPPDDDPPEDPPDDDPPDDDPPDDPPDDDSSDDPPDDGNDDPPDNGPSDDGDAA